MIKRPWTAADDQQLRELAGKISPQRIGVRMRRTLHAISSRAEMLNVTLLHKPRLRQKEPGRSQVEAGSETLC